MKRAGLLLIFLLTFIFFVNAQTGADCASAIPLSLDGVCRTYATSSSVGPSLNCINNTGDAPVTYFSFTTNSVPNKVLLNITGPSLQPVEVIMQPGDCSFNYTSSSICFDDGEGLWAPSHTFILVANTTYKLRIRTNVAGNITICANNYNPVNDDCPGAFQISVDPITDNNANATAGPGVTASDLCASSLENTAFYAFTVDATGTATIILNKINCDNRYAANSTGFQIGFFTGTCSSLTPLSCYSGSGSFVSATTPSLSAGANVYVAIDGTSGANCSYEINAINAQVLTTSIKNFSGWKTGDINLLNWTTLDEKINSVYEIQRSYNRKDFVSIGKLSSSSVLRSQSQYRFEDKTPPPIAYYRIKFIEAGNRISYSKVILLKRDLSPINQVEVVNPVTGGMLTMRVYSEKKADYHLSIINTLGQVVMTDKLICKDEQLIYQRSVSALPSGIYHVVISDPDFKIVKSFVKN